VGDVVWNPSSKRDMTIRLELEFEEDIDSKIAALASLKRMGRFREAHEYFRANLADYLQDSVPVMVEYADMLLAQGYFSCIFESFDDDAITKSCMTVAIDELSAEQVNLVLVLQLARSYSDPDMQTALNVAQMASKFLETRPPRNSHGCIGSAELHVLCRYLKLSSYIRMSSNILWAAHFELRFGWQQWVGLYRDLLGGSRHWDLRDSMDAFVSAFGPRQACISLLGEDSVEAGISKLFDDWGRTVPTETSELCLLDILVCFCRECVVMEDEDNPMGLGNFLSERARVVASSVNENNKQRVKWRPYLEWILVEEARVRLRKSVEGERINDAKTAAGVTSRFFRGLPGWTTWSGALPIYAPNASENPGWPAFGEGIELSDGLLGVVLKVSEEFGNFSTQASSLGELICRSRDPRSLFAKLDRLQLSVMGDKLGALRTRLSKYLLTVDDECRRLLKEELLDLDPRLLRWRNFVQPLAQWCHLRVLNALMLSTGSSSEELRNADSLAETLRHQLPQNFLAKLNSPLPTAPRLAAPPVTISPGDEDAPATGNEREPGKKKVTIDEDVDEESVSSDSSESSLASRPIPPPKAVDPSRYQAYVHPPPPPTEVPAPAATAVPPPPTKSTDPEVEAMKAKLELFEKERQREEDEKRRKEIEEKIRRDTEEALQRRMQDIRKTQEEAKKEIEKAKADAERAARERIEAERKAEEERQRLHIEAMARAERDAREKIEAEMKAAEDQKKREAEAEAAVEARIKAGVEEAIKAMEDAKAAAAKKAAEEAAWRRKVEEEARAMAEKAAEAKMAEAVAAAIAKTKAEMMLPVRTETTGPEENGQVG
jgi:hypothetical protein